MSRFTNFLSEETFRTDVVSVFCRPSLPRQLNICHCRVGLSTTYASSQTICEDLTDLAETLPAFAVKSYAHESFFSWVLLTALSPFCRCLETFTGFSPCPVKWCLQNWRSRQDKRKIRRRWEFLICQMDWFLLSQIPRLVQINNTVKCMLPDLASLCTWLLLLLLAFAGLKFCSTIYTF